MEKGILFSKAEKTPKEYQKSFCFAEMPKSAFWDGEDQIGSVRREVTQEEARRYDAIMEEVVSILFF